LALIDKINGDLIRYLSSSGSSSGSSSSNPGSFSASSSSGGAVQLSQSLSTLSSVFENSYIRTSNAISALHSVEERLSELLSITDKLFTLAEKAADPGTSVEERGALNSKFQNTIADFNKIVADSSAEGTDLLDKNVIGEILKSAGVNTNSAQSIVQLFNKLAGADGVLAFKKIYVPGVTLTSSQTVTTTETTTETTTNPIAPGTFADKASFAVGTTPESIVTADLDQDGNLDIIVAAAGDDNINVFFGDGAGNFSAATSLSAGVNPTGVAVADLNGDTFLDIAATSATDNSVGVLFGNGDRTFSAVESFSGGSSPADITIADVNDDSYLDIVTVSDGDNGVNVLLNDGLGSFTSGLAPTTSDTPVAVATGDFNNDNRLDILAATNSGDTLNLFEQSIFGLFPSRTNVDAGSGENSLVVVDIDGDNNADIVTASTTDSNVNVLLGNGDGTFNSILSYSAGSGTRSLALDDFNDDGELDIVAISSGDNKLNVLFGDGTGNFTTSFSKDAGTVGALSGHAIATGDFNNDGLIDIVSLSRDDGNANVFLQLTEEEVTTTTTTTTSSTQTVTESAVSPTTGNPLQLNLSSRAHAVLSMNTLSELRKDITKDLKSLQDILKELSAANDFALGGLKAVTEDSSVLSETNADKLAQALVSSIKKFTKDPLLGIHSAIDSALAAELLG